LITNIDEFSSKAAKALVVTLVCQPGCWLFRT